MWAIILTLRGFDDALDTSSLKMTSGFVDILSTSSLKMTSGFDDVVGTPSAKISENNLLKFQIVHHCQNDLMAVSLVADARYRQHLVTAW